MAPTDCWVGDTISRSNFEIEFSVILHYNSTVSYLDRWCFLHDIVDYFLLTPIDFRQSKCEDQSLNCLLTIALFATNMSELERQKGQKFDVPEFHSIGIFN